jgi:DNA polymerase-1
VLYSVNDTVSVVCAPGLAAVAFYSRGKVIVARECDFVSAEYKAFLESFFGENIRKCGSDIKTDIRQLLDMSIEARGYVFDTALCAYLLDPSGSNYSVEKLALSYLSMRLPPSKGFEDASAFSAPSMDNSAEEAIAAHAAAVFLLYGKLKELLEESDMKKLYYELELPLCEVLASMEHVGMKVDANKLSEFSDMLSERIEKAREKIYGFAGYDFNINSTKMLGTVLFEKLGLPPVKKTKTGYSTDIEVLEKLRGMHPIVGEIIEYRQLTKLKSTYAEGLLKVIGSDGRIHTKFNMMATATGRLSSTDPNLQNIPIRQDLGSEIRKMFVAEEGHLLVDADYSQIELRVLAHIADDKAMKEAFGKGKDIHTITASQVFGISPDDVTPELRRRAKAVNFGIVYGISDFSLAEDIGVTRAEAKQYMESYLNHYSGIREYMRTVVESAKETGYVKTIMNRRRYLPELRSKNFNIRSFGERAALNTPIQGSAADIIKMAMLRVHRRLKNEGLRSKLVLQVHDELIVEAPEDEAGPVTRILTEEMENVVGLRVPLVAEASYGKTWYDAK